MIQVNLSDNIVLRMQFPRRVVALTSGDVGWVGGEPTGLA